jgi:hypothetical protein
MHRVGDPTVSGSVGESSLDIELIMGLLGPGQNLSLYQVAQPKASLDPSEFSSSLNSISGELMFTLGS